MRKLIPLIFLLFISCNDSSNITIKHLSVSALPMVCDQDHSILQLTDSLLFSFGLQPEVIKVIQDSVRYYFYSNSIVSNTMLIDEVDFPKGVFHMKGIDSLQLIISRDFDGMIFNDYGTLSSGAVTAMSIGNGLWEINNQIVKVREDSVTKQLSWETKSGKRLWVVDIVPSRMYVSDIRFKERLIVYYADRKVDSIWVCSPKAKNRSNIGRFAESLAEAKSL